MKKNGVLHGYVNACPHLGVRLDWIENQLLDSDCELIQCATHGALFEISTGNCIYGPCQGNALQPLLIEVREGVIYTSEASE